MMKTTRSLLAAGTMAVFCCSLANAQNYSQALVGTTLIYSNAFNGSGSVNITNTQANFEAGVLGGSSNTNWIESLIGNTNALYADGTQGSGQGDAWLLPFVPQTGYVYAMNASVNFLASLNLAVGAGWANYYTNNSIANNGRFNSGGVDWGALNEATQNTQAFGGPNTANTIANVNGSWTPPFGVHTLTMILDTTGTKWVAACYVDGVQLSSNFTYASNPTIKSVGIYQNGGALLNQNTYKWTSFTVSATPLVITKQPVSANVNVGSTFTNTVVVSAATPSYQWFTNNAPIPGATNASLILTNVTAGNAGTNYYVVITNTLGSITSAPVSLTVFTNPVFVTAFPTSAFTNLITFYGGTNISGTNYLGSTPTFTVSTLGGQPLTYQWLTNGVAVAGATDAIFTFTNCQLSSPTNFLCVASNSYGMASNGWSVSYVQTPTASFPQIVLSNMPIALWRLNEGPDDGNGDNGVVALDYGSGNDGLYTNAVLGNLGYTNTSYTGYPVDPTDASARFNFAGAFSDVFGIQGIDFATNTSAAFTVQAWVNASATQPNGAPLIAKGFNGGEQFSLDVNGNKWRFLVRNAAGIGATVTAGTGPDNKWHLIIGVCNQASGTISLYVDGLTVGSTAFTAGSGAFSTAAPITIGARGSSATDINSLQLSGYLSDVAVYNRALTAGQIAQIWPYPLTFTFVPPLPPTNYVYLTGGTISIPATVFGQAPMGYYWTNVTAGGVVASGSTNVTGSLNLNATLTVSNASTNLSGKLLELIVTNAASSTNWFVSLFSPPPPIPVSYTNPILYSNFFNGGTWSIGGMPLTAANVLVGGTNTTWTDVLGINGTNSLQANGIPTTGQGDCWLVPFTAHAGYLYTLESSVTISSPPGSWVGVGFAQFIPTNATPNCAFNNSAVNGFAYAIDTSGATENLQCFSGPAGGGAGQVVNVNFAYPPTPTTVTNTTVLDTTGSNWTATYSVNGVVEGSNSYPANNLPAIGAVGLTQNALALSTNVQWNYFSLTEVAPGGVPPYLLSPLPPTNNIVLTNATVSIPATAFGSAPLGYYWSNNSTVLASGSTNNMAPLPANLSIASSNLSAGPLALVVTNAFGTNTTLITLVSPINPNPGPIQFQFLAASNQLTLAWPTNLGWTLQIQTNSLLNTNWVDVPGSTTVTNLAISIIKTNPSAFYRLRR